MAMLRSHALGPNTATHFYSRSMGTYFLLGSTATWPVAARAQQRERVRRVSVLMPFTADDPGRKPPLAVGGSWRCLFDLDLVIIAFVLFGGGNPWWFSSRWIVGRTTPSMQLDATRHE